MLMRLEWEVYALCKEGDRDTTRRSEAVFMSTWSKEKFQQLEPTAQHCGPEHRRVGQPRRVSLFGIVDRPLFVLAFRVSGALRF